MDPSTKRELLARLERDALHLCARFGLRYRVLEAERANVKRRYGVCFSDGTIRIRLRHASTGRALKYSSLVNTLCHELAHLQHFNHGPRFQALYARILACARRDGLYRPKQAEGWDSRVPPRAIVVGDVARAAVRPGPIDPRGVPPLRARPGTAAIQLDLFGMARQEAPGASIASSAAGDPVQRPA
ncbi:MAG: M48 family metallopeptidase [Deltaproteobacteria bacterium]|nr:M48 family metallopeptidase [Deltaproteobacteria bacterium]